MGGCARRVQDGGDRHSARASRPAAGGIPRLGVAAPCQIAESLSFMGDYRTWEDLLRIHE